MSEELEQKVEQEVEQKEQVSADELGQLMQEGSAEAQQAKLEGEAVAAAEAAVRAAESAIAGAAAPQPTPAPAPVQTASTRSETGMSTGKLWMLRAVLILNFALMGVMIALPGPSGNTDHTGTATEHEADTHTEPNSPFVAPKHDPNMRVPSDRRYDEALLAARDRNYERAAELMHSYVRTHQHLHPSLLEGSYILLARYLRLSGRTDEAVLFEVEARKMVGAAHLPNDLWQTARAAEKNGDAREMRRAYARLLLQRELLTPSQLSVITEAYLKLGDSYRMEASLGADKAREEDAKRIDDLRKSDDSAEHGKHR